MKFHLIGTTGVEGDETIPTSYSLNQNFPNPFNPRTEIRYSIAHSGFVRLQVFNILGEEVAQLVHEYKNTGTYLATFDASNLSSGIYFSVLSSGGFLQSKKMTLLK